jgi:hypothetical protein
MRIESFSFGSITIDGEIYGNDVVLLPPRVISSWWRKEGHRLSLTDLAEVLEYQPDAIIVGSGVSNMMKVSESTIRDVESAGIRVEVLPTAQACKRFNRLIEKGEKVAGAMHLTC